MPPSSLILAVIVAVWAAYVIQHWVRRREHVATARSVDRFSEAMRVLERRQLRPQVDLSVPTPRSYAVSVMRPGAPDVVVKRAQSAMPSVAAPELSAATGSSRLRGATRSAEARQARMGTTRMRGITVLSAVAILVGSFLGAAVGLLSWWMVLVAVGVVGVCLAVVRRSVSQASAVSTRSIRPAKAAPVPVGRRARRSMASAGGSAAAAFASNLHGEQLTSRRIETSQLAGEEAAPSATPPVAAPVVATADTSSVSAALAESRGVYDIEAVEQLTSAAPQDGTEAAPVVAEPLVPGTWAPIPVPPPTYTLKAKAQPRPVRAELPTELPQDGIALSLEEEFEELPSAIRGLA